MAVEWHAECLRNSKNHLARKLEELARLQADIARIERVIAFREIQIASAISEGKPSFDDARYTVKKRNTPTYSTSKVSTKK